MYECGRMTRSRERKRTDLLYKGTAEEEVVWARERQRGAAEELAEEQQVLGAGERDWARGQKAQARGPLSQAWGKTSRPASLTVTSQPHGSTRASLSGRAYLTRSSAKRKPPFRQSPR